MSAQAGEGSRASHPAFRALGDRELPETIQLENGVHRRVRSLQHSFFSATGLYETEGGERMIYKVGREAPLFGLPLRFLGRLLTRHELDLYRAVRGIPGVPDQFESVGDTGLARPFIDGHPLERGERVDDEFFPRLQRLLRSIHERDVALVDLQKSNNVLVGSDGKPYLFDFGGSWRLRASGLQRLFPRSLRRAVLRRLQTSDDFHVLKHWRRSRPDTISAEELARSSRPGPWIRIHRVFHNKWRAFRRWLFQSHGDA